tara:strand:- start:1112 stop:1732 length:621 start_codon:yes stop_codon:yes gene_type:complete
LLKKYRGLHLKNFDSILKRIIDLFASFFGLIILSPVIFFAWLIASFEVKGNGFFSQSRIGKNGKPFRLIKIKTMQTIDNFKSTITTKDDPRITFSGKLFRKTKIDELPQLWNVFCGDMSLVGPRPDVKGFADQLKGDERLILTVRPGITGPASIEFKDEEEILASKSNPEKYNKEVIYPKKVQLNLDYIRNWTLLGDLKYILKTLF